MATVPSHVGSTSGVSSQPLKPGATCHIKLIPEEREIRTLLRAECVTRSAALPRELPPGKDELEQVARATLASVDLPEGYVGWTMVALASEFWRSQVAATPYARRLLLLPQSLRHSDDCAGAREEEHDPQTRHEPRRCGACDVTALAERARKRGYRVMAAEDSANVLEVVVSGAIDSIVGVASLDTLEKAIDKVLLAGIPCMAVPLQTTGAGQTPFDSDWVIEMIDLEHRPALERTRTYVHLMRAAHELFSPHELNRLAPRMRGGPRLADLNGRGIAGLDPVAATEAIAYDFLAKGGKHSRPFITLAIYDAAAGGAGALENGAEHLAKLPDAVKRVAMSIETFHKASLVHDDIEDDDLYRYGEKTLHHKYGVPTAINIGDYLIGLGYRLISREAATLGAETASDILDRLAVAHMKLAEGQGAELLWRDSLNKRLLPADALNLYALKTAPAFEAALYAGLRMASWQPAGESFIEPYARNLGIAFQILNDLKDWTDDDHNKLLSGGDVLGGRPTVLWALALEGLNDAEREELESLAAQSDSGLAAIQRIRALYRAAGVFAKAEQLIDAHYQRAVSLADRIDAEPVRRLLHYLVETVLSRSES